jgi:hypothetical protein
VYKLKKEMFMNKDTLLELLLSAENALEGYYVSGSRYDIEHMERRCAELEREMVSFDEEYAS